MKDLTGPYQDPEGDSPGDPTDKPTGIQQSNKNTGSASRLYSFFKGMVRVADRLASGILLILALVSILLFQETIQEGSFWISPWTIGSLALAALSVALSRYLHGLIKKHSLPFLFESFARFTVLLARVFLYTIWLAVLRASGEPQMREVEEVLFIAGITIALFVLLLWLGYGKVMRGRMEQNLVQDLVGYAKSRGGRIFDSGGIHEHILSAKSIRHTVTMTYSGDRQWEEIPVVVAWSDPVQGIMVHWHNTMRRNPSTKNWSHEKDWTFGIMGKIPERLRSRIPSGVYTPDEFASAMSFPGDWRSYAANFRIRSIEVTANDFMITWKPRFDWLILSVHAPDMKRLDAFLRDLGRWTAG